MTWDNSKYVKLKIGVQPKVGSKYLIALRSTADYYGWSKEFEPWSPKVVEVRGNYTFVKDPGRRGEMFCEAGRRHRICRSPKTAGMPAGFTNQFKVSANCGLSDLAELAHFTTVDWHWLDSPFGERISRERWESLYQADTSRAKGGLVSV